MFSGHTHASKIEDMDDALRVAIDAYRMVDADKQLAKAKAVRRLATRLLTARLKQMKAYRSTKKPVTGEGVCYEQLLAREEAVRSAGIPSILAEFGVGDIIDS